VTARPHDDRRDAGSVLILGAGLIAVALLAVVVLVDAASAYLQRQQLLAVADAAALAGAQAIDLAAYYENGATVATRLDLAAVPARAREHLARSGAAAAIEGLSVERISTDGEQVAVRLQAPLRLPFLSSLARGPVVVESRARLAYRD
jgi:uncharacterized membrane protein